MDWAHQRRARYLFTYEWCSAPPALPTSMDFSQGNIHRCHSTTHGLCVPSLEWRINSKSTKLTRSALLFTSWPARRCLGIHVRAPRWSLSLRSPSSAELSRLPTTPSGGEQTPPGRKLLFDRWTCIIQLSLLGKVTGVIRHLGVHYRQKKKSKENSPPSWRLPLRSPSSAELSRLPITSSRGEHTPLRRKLLFDRWTCIIQLRFWKKWLGSLNILVFITDKRKKSKEKRANCETST